MSTSREEAQKKEKAVLNLIVMIKRVEDKCALIQGEIQRVNDNWIIDVERLRELNAELDKLEKIGVSLKSLEKDIMKSGSSASTIEASYNHLHLVSDFEINSFGGIFSSPPNQKEKNYAIDLKNLKSSITLMEQRIDKECKSLAEKGKRSVKETVYLLELKRMRESLMSLNELFDSSSPLPNQDRVNKLKVQFDKLQVGLHQASFKCKGFARKPSLTSESSDLKNLKNSITEMEQRIDSERTRLEEKVKRSVKETGYLLELKRIEQLMNLARKEVFATSFPLPGQDRVNELKVQFDGLQKQLHQAEFKGKGFVRATGEAKILEGLIESVEGMKSQISHEVENNQSNKTPKGNKYAVALNDILTELDEWVKEARKVQNTSSKPSEECVENMVNKLNKLQSKFQEAKNNAQGFKRTLPEVITKDLPLFRRASSPTVVVDDTQRPKSKGPGRI